MFTGLFGKRFFARRVTARLRLMFARAVCLLSAGLSCWFALSCRLAIKIAIGPAVTRACTFFAATAARFFRTTLRRRAATFRTHTAFWFS